jgi:hypothetical protein
MYLQGQLQNVFDALYELGVIDPVLQRDWQGAMDELPQYLDEVNKAVRVANETHSDIPLLVAKLKSFDSKILEYLAMEVAREFADYHARESLH